MESDSLGVEQAEILKMIEDLRRAVEGLQHVNAGVSSEYAEELQRLREDIVNTRLPSKWYYLLDFAREVLARIAAELLKAYL